MPNPLEYAAYVGLDPSDPASFQAMRMRQEIAKALVARDRKGYPKNIGEGLSAIGDAFAERGSIQEAMRQTAAFEQYQREHPVPIPGGGTDTKARTSDAGDTGDERIAAVADEPPAPPPRDRSIETAIAMRPDTAEAPPPPLPPQMVPPAPPPLSPNARVAAAFGTPPPPLPPPPMAAPGPLYGGIGGAAPMGRGDAQQASLLGDVTGLGTGDRGYNYAPTASLDRSGADTRSDAPPITGISPRVGAAAGDTLQQTKDEIARLLAARGAGPAQAVPQPNPTLGGQPPSSTTPLPTPLRSLGAGSPPEAATNPPIISDIRPIPEAGAQMAEGPAPPRQGIPPPLPTAQAPASTAPAATYMPKPKLPDEPPISREEQLGYAIQRQVVDPQDPRYQQAQGLIAYGAAQRNQEYQARMKEYEQQNIQYHQEQEFLRTRGPEKAAAEAVERTGEAQVFNRTGMKPAELYPMLATERDLADQSIRAMDAQQLARKAIKAGVITGYGATMKVNMAKFADFAFKNGMSADLASNTELMSSALKAGLREAVKIVNGPGGTGVSNVDVKIAEGISGSDPELQMKTIQTIMDRASEIANKHINRYEDMVHRYVSGTPQEANYATIVRPAAPPDHLKMLLDSQNDPTKAEQMRTYFDKTYGPGAADLELARAERRRLRQQR